MHVAADLAVCEGRDPKGLYRRARADGLADFTGVSAPYDVPVAPDLRLDTGALGLEEAGQQLLQFAEAAFASAGALPRTPEGALPLHPTRGLGPLDP